MIIVDSHCHLDMLEEHDKIANYVQRSIDGDVKYLQTICTRIDDFPKILKIAETHDNIFASVGVHPSEISKGAARATSKDLIRLSEHEKVIGLGETGLDYFYNKNDTWKAQADSFEHHIIASQENRLPVIIHTREAEEDTKNIVAKNMKIKHFPALIHCFTASKEFAKQMLDLGLYISISGIVTFKGATDLQEAVKFIPLDRLLAETDSPFLAPVPKRGKTNEPAYTRYVVEFIASLKGISSAEVAGKTTDNFFKLFSKAN